MSYNRTDELSVLDRDRSGWGGAREKGGINYGPGIVIAVATDVTQTKVSMQLNDDDFS